MERRMSPLIFAAIAAHAGPMIGNPSACRGHAIPHGGFRSYAEPPKQPSPPTEPPKCALTLKQRKRLLARKLKRK